MKWIEMNLHPDCFTVHDRGKQHSWMTVQWKTWADILYCRHCVWVCVRDGLVEQKGGGRLCCECRDLFLSLCAETLPNGNRCSSLASQWGKKKERETEREKKKEKKKIDLQCLIIRFHSGWPPNLLHCAVMCIHSSRACSATQGKTIKLCRERERE